MTSLSCIGEGNGNPLQCSCLENPRDGGAWWAAIYGVAQSPTRLKWLSSSSSRTLFFCCCFAINILCIYMQYMHKYVGWLKTQHSKTEDHGIRSITSWLIDGEKVEKVADFIFLGPKITAHSDCSHEIKRCLLLGRKAMTNLDSVLNSRDSTLLTKIQIVMLWLFQ